MSKRLTNVRKRDVERLLRGLGYERMAKRGKGSHQQYRHPATGRWTTLSWKKNGIVPAGTVKSIARDLEMDTQAFLDRL